MRCAWAARKTSRFGKEYVLPAFGLHCGVVEKQSLLEAPDPVARCQLLLRLIEFQKAESELPYAPKMIN